MRKIVIIGPESTGKSTLCEQLAAHYQTVWCPEYAREYLLEHGSQYNYEQLLDIAKGQLALEDRLAEQASQHYFIDTNMYVMKVWSEVVFEQCHSWILKQIASRRYDLYLLCNTELPWVADELREYPDLVTRQRLFHMYKDIVVNSGAPWVEITGVSVAERMQAGVSVVDTVFRKRR